MAKQSFVCLEALDIFFLEAIPWGLCCFASGYAGRHLLGTLGSQGGASK